MQKGGEGRGSEAQGEATVGEMNREGAPEQHYSRGGREEQGEKHHGDWWLNTCGALEQGSSNSKVATLTG
jgi:hypothetical protein